MFSLTFGERQNIQNILANIIIIPIAPAKILLNLPNVAILFADELTFELLELVELGLDEGVLFALAFELLDVELAAAGIVPDVAEVFAVEDPVAVFKMLDVAAAGIVADATEVFVVEDPVAVCKVLSVAAAGIVADVAEAFAVEDPVAVLKVLDVAAAGIVAEVAEVFAVEDPVAVFKVLDVAARGVAAELEDPAADPDPDPEPFPPRQS